MDAMKNSDKNCRSFALLTFECRLEQIKQEIIDSQSHIVSLQEVDHSRKYQAMFDSLGYGITKSTMTEIEDNVTGIIAYKREAVELVHFH